MADIISLTKTRIADNWVDTFMTYTEPVLSPEIFRRWAAYSILSSALERRVWTAMSNKRLHPNLLILLVAEPGIGKTNAIEIARDLLSACGGFNLSPNAMTKAAMVDHIAEKQKTMLFSGKTMIYHSLLAICTEFGTLVPEYDLSFLNTINELYDCMPQYEDRTRGGDKLITIDRPSISIFSGTQPMYLSTILPEAAYGLGFTSRITMISSSEKVENELFQTSDDDSLNAALKTKLVSDLKRITKLVGPFEWAPDARIYIQDWYNNIYQDSPTHPRLQHYCKRRHIHAAKLAMALSVAEDDTLLIEKSHIIAAREILLEAEGTMPEIFKSMNVSQDSMEIEEIHRYIVDVCEKSSSSTISEHKLVDFISRRISAHRISYIIDVMLTAKRMEVSGIDYGRGKRDFKPLHFSNFDNID